jgi:hypothetical protein
VKRYELRLDKTVLHIYASDFDSTVAISEAQHKGVPLSGPYSVQDHSAPLKQMFPDINLPPGNIIESASLMDQMSVTLAEAGEL